MPTAQAKTDLTRTDDPSNWLWIVEDVFPRWRDRLGSKEARNELGALLCDPETRSAMKYVDARGKEVPRTSNHLNAEFWPGRLLLVPDADGGADDLMVDYTPPVHVELPEGGHWEFFVRRDDVARHEPLCFPMSAAPPKSPATRQKSKNKSQRSETVPERFRACAAEYKKGLNGANPAMDRFIAFANIKGHRPELRAAYKELFPDKKPGRPPKNNPPKINPPK